MVTGEERKSGMNIAVLYILLSVLGAASGQVLLKKGMSTLGPVNLSFESVPSIVIDMISTPYIPIGLSIFVASSFFWMIALSRVDLSYAYPFASLGYVIMLFASWQLLNEQINPLRLVGTLVVCLGVILISRS